MLSLGALEYGVVGDGQVVLLLILPAAEIHRNRAGVSKFYFGCFQNATSCSSPCKVFPELRIELTTTLELSPIHN